LGQALTVKYSELDPLDCDTIEQEHPPGWQQGNADKELLSERAQCLTNAQKEPFERKLRFAEKIITRAIEKGVKFSCSYSAGNDSTALSLLLVEHMGLDVSHVMSNTRMEDGLTIKTFGERRKQLQEQGVKIEFALPEKRPNEVWAEHVPLVSKYESQQIYYYMNAQTPEKKQQAFERLKPKTKKIALICAEKNIPVSHKCCDELKKKPMKKWQKKNGIGGVFTGMRAEESRMRRMSYIQGGVLKNDSSGLWMCNPLMVWMKEDIEQWLGTWGLSYRESRNGCTTCMYGAHMRKGEENTLQALRRNNPKMFKKAMEDWGYGKAMRAFGIGQSLDFYSYYHEMITSDDPSIEDFFGL
jgi:3'-phosphoadenosine 5'-phosphosulfate sulfotransferase (PAPS reductase)/FAD synthetase